LNEKANRFSPKHTIAQVFVFVLLGVFAVLSVLMVLLSAQLYRGTVNQTEQHSAQRILSSYVTNIVSANDVKGMISVEKLDGVEMLVLGWDVEGELYETKIYCHDGSLRELFMRASQEFDPEYGEEICAAQAFSPVLNEELLEISLTDGTGHESTLYIALRSGGEA